MLNQLFKVGKKLFSLGDERLDLLFLELHEVDVVPFLSLLKKVVI